MDMSDSVNKFKNSREMNTRLVNEIEQMTYEAKQFLIKHYLENSGDDLTLTLLKNIGIDGERLVSMKSTNMSS
jgi:fructose 1,6-bisphosphatase